MFAYFLCSIYREAYLPLHTPFKFTKSQRPSEHTKQSVNKNVLRGPRSDRIKKLPLSSNSEIFHCLIILQVCFTFMFSIVIYTYMYVCIICHDKYLKVHSI